MIIHPGFIKTGTTSLQDFLIFAHPQIHAMGHPHRQGVDARIAQALRRIEGFDDDPEALRSALAVSLEACPSDRVPVLSDEGLTGVPQLTATIARTVARTDLASQECVDQLLLSALDAGGDDNITVIIVRAS